MAIKKESKYGGYPILPNRPIVTQTEIGNPTSISDGISIIADDIEASLKREGRWEFTHDGVLVRVQLVDKGKRQYTGYDENLDG